MKVTPSLQDYTHFHGMLCRPSTARRCLQSFDGRVLFMPVGYQPPLARFDYSRPVLVGNWSMNPFTTFTYYVLVWISLTGLSTLLKRTKFLQAQETNEAIDGSSSITAEHCSDLRLDPSVLEYLGNSCTLRRRFEYDFKIPRLQVTMLHIEQRGKLSLVEIYRCENWLLRWILRRYQQTLTWLNGRRGALHDIGPKTTGTE